MAWDGFDALAADLEQRYPFLPKAALRRMARIHGTDTAAMLGEARGWADLGERVGENLTAREIAWLADREWARTADDALWRRTKLGLRLTAAQAARVGELLANPG